MSGELDNIANTQDVLDFVKLANDYCMLAENSADYNIEAFLKGAQMVLSALYFKTFLLPVESDIPFDENEKYVTEEMWEVVHLGIKKILKDNDRYLEVFDPDNSINKAPFQASISEFMADIYQDLRDFAFLYGMGTREIILDALREVKTNFHSYWGLKLLNVLRAIHIVINSQSRSIHEDKPTDITDLQNEQKTKNWIIANKIRDFKDEED